MSPKDVERWIVTLRQRADAAAVADSALSTQVTSLVSRVAALEAILLNVPSERLLGRYAATSGPAQFIRIGTGLDLDGDSLVNTGGGGGSLSGWSSGFSSGFS